MTQTRRLSPALQSHIDLMRDLSGDFMVCESRNKTNYTVRYLKRNWYKSWLPSGGRSASLYNPVLVDPECLTGVFHRGSWDEYLRWGPPLFSPYLLGYGKSFLLSRKCFALPFSFNSLWDKNTSISYYLLVILSIKSPLVKKIQRRVLDDFVCQDGEMG